MEYRESSLDEICLKITDGAHYSPKAADEGYPMYSVKDMKYNNFDNTNPKIISEEDYQKLVKQGCRPEKNDVVIAKDGSYLKHVFVIREEIDAALLSSIAILRPNLDLVNPYYLSYFLKQKNVKEHMKNGYVSGSVLPRIILKDFKKYTITLPPLKIQNKVAEILKNLDSKIENNDELIANLEELSQTLFKRWFIDFEFPDENGNPYKSSGGKMKNIGKEEIPINWDKGYLSKYIEGTRSGDWGKETSQGNYVSEVTIIRGADIPPLKTGDLGKPPRRFILEKNTQSKKLLVGDIIVEISGGSPTQSTGRTLYINNKLLEKFNTPVLCTNFCRILRPKNIDFGIWIQFYFSYLYKSDLFFNFENGTTGIKNFDYNSLINKFEIFTPDDSTILTFSNLVNQLYKTIQSYGDESIKLSELRDTLLPKLMSGEIELPDELEVDEHAELLQ